VINTPGHTPGHISLYHKPSKTLIAGDAMRVMDGQLLGPAPEQTLDVDTAIKSFIVHERPQTELNRGVE
jgi:glyoxylase-like metal-dependent hydrolase (beta-lactamase superfamily II)